MIGAAPGALEVDVLVVGAGPVGLTAALLLHEVGLTVAVVERREGPQRSPAAHVVNARTFEIWRQAGADVDRILALAQDPADAGQVHWVTKLGGKVLGSLTFEQQGDDMLAAMHYAAVAAALSTTVPGAVPSMPRREDVLRDL